ncbi:MAG: glyoxalase [Deltaproteobacteria bacterium]|nr:MAG: glyoxalase [Deltaproteobacteria bacterium]
MNIKMTSIPVKDPIAAHRFYTEVLGFTEVMFVPEAQFAIVASPEQPNGTALLLEPTGEEFYASFQSKVYEKGLPVLVLGSQNAQQDYETLKEKGVVFTQEPTDTDYGTIAVFDDTCGNYIQIHQDKA